MNLAGETIEKHLRHAKRFLDFFRKDPRLATADDLREFLKQYVGKPIYRNMLASLRRFFRDFLGMDVANRFKLPRPNARVFKLPTREELKRFYQALGTRRDRALFLIYATGGLRRHEPLELTRRDIDLEKRMILPPNGNESNSTKRRWVTFFNDEAKEALLDHLAAEDGSEKIFNICADVVDRIFRKASERSGVKITPQTLRFWFSVEMARLGVPDRYVDAFCGRVPRSVLARHYTDYSPERLKEIYDRANLKVLA
jgi:integrase